MIATQWPQPPTISQSEQIVARMHGFTQPGGVIRASARRSVPGPSLMATEHSSGIPPVIWWNNLERIHLAIDDLDCRELLS